MFHADPSPHPHPRPPDQGAAYTSMWEHSLKYKKTMSFSIGFYEMDDPGINPRPDGGWVVLWQWGILVKRGPLESEVEYNVLLHRIPVPFMRNCVFFGGYRVISDLYKLYPLQAGCMEFHLGRFELIV